MKRYHNISEVYCDVIYHDLDIILSYRSALITAAVKSLNMMNGEYFFFLCATPFMQRLCLKSCFSFCVNNGMFSFSFLLFRMGLLLGICVSLLFGSAWAVDRGNFKTCDQSAFCK